MFSDRLKPTSHIGIDQYSHVCCTNVEQNFLATVKYSPWTSIKPTGVSKLQEWFHWGTTFWNHRNVSKSPLENRPDANHGAGISKPLKLGERLAVDKSFTMVRIEWAKCPTVMAQNTSYKYLYITPFIGHVFYPIEITSQFTNGHGHFTVDHHSYGHLSVIST